MPQEFNYKQEAAAEYDRAFAHVSQHFLPFLLRSARLAPGMHVLDIATGTGLAAAEALTLVGPSGSVLAADLYPAMVEQARQRLGNAPNVSFAVENGQDLSLSANQFDAVICSLGLMFFPDPARGLCEFFRVLRPGGCAAASVLTVPERSYNGRINAVIAKHVPAIANATARTFSLGDPARLRQLFEKVGFEDVQIATKSNTFVMPSFATYFGPFERGGGSTGQAYLELAPEVRAAVREEMRISLNDRGGPVEIEVEFQFGSGNKPG